MGCSINTSQFYYFYLRDEQSYYSNELGSGCDNTEHCECSDLRKEEHLFSGDLCYTQEDVTHCDDRCDSVQERAAILPTMVSTCLPFKVLTR